MSKKTDHERDKDEEKDLEEEEEEGSDEEEGEEHAKDEEDDEEEEASAAPPTKAPAAGRSRPRARARREHDDHNDEHEDHGHAHDEDEESAEDDPTWWAPHAVMSVLVLTGVLGFFGVFNKLLGPLVGKPVHAAEEKTATATTATAAHAATPGTYRARHLLVAYKGAMRAAPSITRTEDEAKARATEALGKAKAGKVKFEDLVKEYSDEPNAGARGGDLGQFRKGQMVPEFQNAVEKLKVGQTSDLVKTAFGYHVILRTE
jgi:parvulin-like peptidyl-prolyl isomerase